MLLSECVRHFFYLALGIGLSCTNSVLVVQKCPDDTIRSFQTLIHKIETLSQANQIDVFDEILTGPAKKAFVEIAGIHKRSREAEAEIGVGGAKESFALLTQAGAKLRIWVLNPGQCKPVNEITKKVIYSFDGLALSYRVDIVLERSFKFSRGGRVWKIREFKIRDEP